MVYVIGFIVSLVLWLFTLKAIVELDTIVLVKIFYGVVIVVFPFVGVLYPVYVFVSQYMMERGYIR